MKEQATSLVMKEEQLPVRVSSGCPFQKLSTKEVSGNHPIIQLWLNQEATPWINLAQIPLMERIPSQPESQQRLPGEQIKFSHF